MVSKLMCITLRDCLRHTLTLLLLAPVFVPTMNMKEYEQHDLENRVAEVERKGSINSHVEG